MLHISHRTFVKLSLPLWIISYVLATFVRQICLHTLLAWYTTHGFPKHTLIGPFSWIHMATYYWHHKFTSGWSTSVNWKVLTSYLWCYSIFTIDQAGNANLKVTRCQEFVWIYAISCSCGVILNSLCLFFLLSMVFTLCWPGWLGCWCTGLLYHSATWPKSYHSMEW